MKELKQTLFNRTDLIETWWMQWLVIPILGGMTIAVFFCWDCLMELRYEDYARDALISITFWTVLGNGNSVLICFMEKRWSWLEYPVRRFLISLLFLLVYTTGASLLVVFAYVNLVFNVSLASVIESQGLFSLLKIPLGITIFISLLMHGRAFLIAWRREAIHVERLKNENLAAKFESLKNQVNPHFLFNSLNALTSLVYSDQEKAVDFIHKLSEVYRYVLDHQHDELVDLMTEMELVRAFVFLNKIRFGENLQVEYKGIEGLNSKQQVPPLTLQMLIENCFKHNEISKENKLKVSVVLAGEKIIVSNNKNPLKTPKNDSNNLGLKNIILRYEFLTKDEIEIIDNKDEFKVIVPLLTVNNQ